MLDCLMKHQGHQTCPVHHRCAYLVLLLIQLFQLLQLWEMSMKRGFWGPIPPLSPTQHCSLPHARVLGPPQHASASPSSSGSCTNVWGGDRNYQWVQRHCALVGNHIPHHLVPVGKNKGWWGMEEDSNGGWPGRHDKRNREMEGSQEGRREMGSDLAGRKRGIHWLSKERGQKVMIKHEGRS